MWSFVAQKGSGSLAEDIGKSVSTVTWGDPVNLHVSVPASSAEQGTLCLRICVSHVCMICGRSFTQRLNVTGQTLWKM